MESSTSNPQEQKKYEKALPEISTLTKPFWDYCKKHELRMQYCSYCSEWIWYPKAWCPSCGGRDGIEWRKLSGNGSVYSFTVIRQVIDNSPAFQQDLPFVIGLIDLDEGPRIYSNITGVKPEEVSIGDHVALYFDDVTPEITLPKFKKLQ
jgi:uncharacterized OB-fold protein